MEAALLLLLDLAVAAASTCADEPLWVDGVATSCADAALDCGAWFCPTCPYAHACDRHCGYCGGCGVGEVEDCAGVCLAAEDCALADYGYATCDDWRGSGCCEAGGLVSDAGFAPRFDCAEFGCDGGDCESCEGEDTTVIGGAPRAPWCLLLTATVCPARDMTHTARRDPALRRGDYERALARWAKGTSLPVVLVENSGAHLGTLRDAHGGATFVSFVDGAVDAAKGKGHAEARAIRRALDSGILDGCERVVKVTGRYFLEGLDAALAAVDPAAALVVQSAPSPWQMADGVLRSEVVGFRNEAGLFDGVFGGQDEARGAPMERVLFVAANALRDAGLVVAELPRLAVPETINAEHKQVITEL